MCVLPGRGESLQSREDVSPCLCDCFLSGAPIDSVNRLGGNLFLLLCRSRRNVTTTHQRVYTSQGEADLRGLRRIGQSRRLTYVQRMTGVVSFSKELSTFFPFFRPSLTGTLSPSLSLFSAARSLGDEKSRAPSVKGGRAKQPACWADYYIRVGL